MRARLATIAPKALHATHRRRPAAKLNRQQISPAHGGLRIAHWLYTAQIIHENDPMLLKQNPTDPEEIEIDIDAIDEQTLRCVLAGRIRVPTPNQTEPNVFVSVGSSRKACHI